jgi:hypothetical protein
MKSIQTTVCLTQNLLTGVLLLGIFSGFNFLTELDAVPSKYGSWVGTAVNLGRDAKGDNVSYRGIVVRLNESGNACVVFDGDTMRMAAGWTKGGLKLDGLPFTGGHGRFPSHGGEKLFVTQAAPGWASPKGELADPREGKYSPLGPLPRDWAKFGGLYVHGNRVVLKYTVGGAKVLESPSLVEKDGLSAIIRTIRIAGDGKDKTLVLSDARDGEVVTTAHVPEGAKLEIKDGLNLLHLPGNKGVTTFQVLYGKGSLEDLKKISTKPEDLLVLTKGGGVRWKETVKTKGEVSKEDKAYVIDRLTVPYNNPYGMQIRIGGFDFFKDGKTAAISTWDGDVWLVRNIDEKLENLEWKRFAAGLHEPLGLKIVDDVIYTVADDQITRFHDFNGDDEADFYENFNNDWDLTSGFHAFCFDLHTDKVGNFYFAFGSPVRSGGRSFERLGRHHGSIIKISKDGSRLERYATGLRAPNGMGVSPDGQVTSGDNEGTFVPRSPINWMKPGSFHGVVDVAADYDKFKTTPTVGERSNGRPQHLDPTEAPKPLAWLPKGVDNSGGGQVWVTSDRWGPFDKELLHMSYGRSALYLVLKEDKAGQMQGGVVKFPLRFTSSCMRGRFNPHDGQLYVSGLKGWQTNAGKQGGLDRVRFTGKMVAMPKGLRIKSNGIEIDFTAKLDKELAEDRTSYSIRSSNIRWTHGYGSGDQDKKTYEVKAAKLLGDGKTVFLEVPTIGPAHQMEIDIDIETVDGDEIVTKIWNTVHVVN